MIAGAIPWVALPAHMHYLEEGQPRGLPLHHYVETIH